MKFHIRSIASLVIIACGTALTGCQSSDTGTQAAKPAATGAKSSDDLCTKYRNAGNYNTAVGRMLAKFACDGTLGTATTTEMWREHTRQSTCKAQTGDFCPD